MLVTIITNIIDGALTSIWLLNDRIMNSGFFDGIEQLFGTDAEVISHVFIHFNKVFLSIIAFCTLWRSQMRFRAVALRSITAARF